MPDFCPNCGAPFRRPTPLHQLGDPDVYLNLVRRLARKRQEMFFVVGLDADARPARRHLIAVGNGNSVRVMATEVFRPLVRERSAAAILLHNHPGADAAPSQADIVLTKHLVDVGQILGIPVLDHVIVGGTSYYSFRDDGAMPQ